MIRSSITKEECEELGKAFARAADQWATTDAEFETRDKAILDADKRTRAMFSHKVLKKTRHKVLKSTYKRSNGRFSYALRLEDKSAR